MLGLKRVGGILIILLTFATFIGKTILKIIEYFENKVFFICLGKIFFKFRNQYIPQEETNKINVNENRDYIAGEYYISEKRF